MTAGNETEGPVYQSQSLQGCTQIQYGVLLCRMSAVIRPIRTLPIPPQSWKDVLI